MPGYKEAINHLRNAAVPGSAFDKDALWKDLDKRLFKNPTKRKRRYYPVAAALLAGAFCTLWLLMKKEQQPLRETTQAVGQPIVEPVSNATDISSKTAATTMLQTSRKPAPVKQQPALSKEPAPVQLAVTDSIEGLQQLVTAPELPPKQDTLVPRVLPVVHVNEWNNGGKEYINLDKNERNFLRLRLFKKDVSGINRKDKQPDN